MNGKRIIGPCIFHQSSCLTTLLEDGSSHGNKDKEGQVRSRYKREKCAKERQEERGSGRSSV